MRNVILLGILLLGNTLFCQKDPWKFDQKNNEFQIHAGDRVGYAKIIYQQGKRKRGRQILKDVIEDELSNTVTRGESLNTYSITAAENLIKIDSLEGFNYLLQLYRHFEDLKDSYSKRNYYWITNLVKKWSKRNYDLGYETERYLEEQIYSFKGKEKLYTKSKINQEIDSIIFISYGMGWGFEMKMWKDSIKYMSGSPGQREEEFERKSGKIEHFEWNTLLKNLEEVDFEMIHKLKSPTNGRRIDGANYSYMRIHTKTKMFKSADFDGFKANEVLSPFVRYMKYLMKKKMNR